MITFTEQLSMGFGLLHTQLIRIFLKYFSSTSSAKIQIIEYQFSYSLGNYFFYLLLNLCQSVKYSNSLIAVGTMNSQYDDKQDFNYWYDNDQT